MKWHGWLGFDVVFLALLVVVVGPPAAAVCWLATVLPWPAWVLGLLSPVAGVLFLVLLCGTAGSVRLLLPRLQPGTYPFPGHPQSVAWMAHFALQRIINFRLWSVIIFSFVSLRWLALRALGAKVAFSMKTSNDTLLTDPSLLEAGVGSMLAAHTVASGHFVENDQLMLAKVVLAPGVQAMGGVTLAPGVRVGSDTVLGPGSKFLPHVTIGEDVYIGLGCTVYSGVTIGSNAVIGHQTTLENDVSVGEGAVVQPFSRVPKGTVIAAGESFPPKQASRSDSAPALTS